MQFLTGAFSTGSISGVVRLVNLYAFLAFVGGGVISFQNPLEVIFGSKFRNPFTMLVANFRLLF